MFLVARLMLGGFVLWRVRVTAAEVSSEAQDLAAVTAKRLGLRKAPRVLASLAIADAAACGSFKSVVLIPASWLSEMLPEMIQAVLAHEFSHIRRHDVSYRISNMAKQVCECVSRI